MTFRRLQIYQTTLWGRSFLYCPYGLIAPIASNIRVRRPNAWRHLLHLLVPPCTYLRFLDFQSTVAGCADNQARARRPLCDNGAGPRVSSIQSRAIGFGQRRMARASPSPHLCTKYAAKMDSGPALRELASFAFEYGLRYTKRQLVDSAVVIPARRATSAQQTESPKIFDPLAELVGMGRWKTHNSYQQAILYFGSCQCEIR